MSADATAASAALPARAPSPLCRLGDSGAELYFGHLAARAEAALPAETREAQIALAWVAAHVARDGARLWRARFDGISVDGTEIGDWTLQARLARPARDARGARPGIELARRSWLREDGRQIMAIGHPFLEREDVAGDEQAALSRLVDFASIQVIAALSRRGGIAEITDALGAHIAMRADPATLRTRASRTARRAGSRLR